MTIEQVVPILGVLVPVLGGVDFLVRKWLQKHRDELLISMNAQVTALRGEVSDRTKERDKADDELKELERSHTAKVAELVVANHRVATLEGEGRFKDTAAGELQVVKDALDKKQKTHDGRIRRAFRWRAAIWTQPVMAGTPEFVSLASRTPIVSVLNLKGGVGKTTLTAYLAWAALGPRLPRSPHRLGPARLTLKPLRAERRTRTLGGRGAATVAPALPQRRPMRPPPALPRVRAAGAATQPPLPPCRGDRSSGVRRTEPDGALAAPRGRRYTDVERTPRRA